MIERIETTYFVLLLLIYYFICFIHVQSFKHHQIQHLTKREVILALPGWPLIRSAWLAVTKLPVFLSSCLPVFRPCQHRPLRTTAHRVISTSCLESSEQSKTCVKLIKRIPKFITRSPLLIGKIEVIEYYLLISS